MCICVIEIEPESKLVYQRVTVSNSLLPPGGEADTEHVNKHVKYANKNSFFARAAVGGLNILPMVRVRFPVRFLDCVYVIVPCNVLALPPWCPHLVYLRDRL